MWHLSTSTFEFYWWLCELFCSLSNFRLWFCQLKRSQHGNWKGLIRVDCWISSWTEKNAITHILSYIHIRVTSSRLKYDVMRIDWSAIILYVSRLYWYFFFIQGLPCGDIFENNSVAVNHDLSGDPNQIIHCRHDLHAGRQPRIFEGRDHLDGNRFPVSLNLTE